MRELSSRCRSVLLALVLPLGGASGPYLVDAQTAKDGAAAQDHAVAFRAKMDSKVHRDWWSALKDLAVYVSPDGKPPPEERVTAARALLQQYLDRTRCTEVPARTEEILKDPIVGETVEIGQGVLLLLLVEESHPYQSQVLLALSRNAADRTRRDALFVVLQETTVPLLFSRLFPIVGYQEPQRALEIAMAMLELDTEALPKQVVVDTLNSFLQLQHDNAAAWLAWWTQNRGGPLLKDLHRRQQEGDLRKLMELYELGKGTFRSDPAERRKWQLLLLGEPQFRPLRGPALKDLAQFARSLTTNGSEKTPEARDLLRPVVDRLVALARDPEWSEYQGLIMDALAEMKPLRDQPDLLALLNGALDELAKARTRDSLQYRFGLQAIRVATRLEAKIGDTLDTCLEKLLEADDWQAASKEAVLEIVESLKTIGIRARSVDLMKRIYYDLPEASELVVQVFKAKAAPPLDPDPKIDRQARETILDILKEVVETSAPGEGETLRYAILGIGVLRLPKGIDSLVAYIARAPTSETRFDAIRSIAVIGDFQAMEQFRTIWQQSADEPLKAEIRSAALGLCKADGSLRLLETFVLGKEERMAWFEGFIAEPDIKKLLDPNENGASILGGDPLVFARWYQLRLHLCQALRDGAYATQDPVLARTQYQELRDSAKQVLAVAPQELANFPRETFTELGSIGKHRARILELLEKGGYKEILTSLQSLLESVVDRSSPDPRVLHITWVLDAVRARPKAAGEKEFLLGLRALLDDMKELKEAENVAQRLAELEERNRDTEPPPSSGGAEGRPQGGSSGGGR